MAGRRLAALGPRLFKNVTSEGKTRQKQVKNGRGRARLLGVLNEHFPPVFNAALLAQHAVVFTHSGPKAKVRELLRQPNQWRINLDEGCSIPSEQETCLNIYHT